MFYREDDRDRLDLRPISFEIGAQRDAAGSVICRWGNTHVICSATFEDRVPQHRLGMGGWLSAEYSLLPGSTDGRARRERPNPSGRSAEIQRLIGRSLRSCVDLQALGPRTIWIDCDVLQADGGTRCAAITGGYVALAIALHKIHMKPRAMLAAVSVGLVRDEILVDLAYGEDKVADVDLVYVAGPQGLAEVHGGVEGRFFKREQLKDMLDAADNACTSILAAQTKALIEAGVLPQA